ncbi:flavin reductase family protein [Sneathiella aquimaris]|uniref:flavin reductase family protein n=1 Tax=Sneathiella aquimaris TaxID=2599305 RepID=UPI00146AFFEC|nr:flavin reductase family protein [Sneathiella aquimaris]
MSKLNPKGISSVSNFNESLLTPQNLRRVFSTFATGVVVVTYKTEDGPRGFTANSFTSVSMEPPLILVCIDKHAKSCVSMQGQSFAINILSAEQRDIAMHFSGKPQDIPIGWSQTNNHFYLDEKLAVIFCDPWEQIEAGDHAIFLGRVTGYEVIQQDPLGFFQGRFFSFPND